MRERVMRPTDRSWTEDERERLRCLWPLLKPHQIGEFIGRSAGAVIAEAKKLRDAGEPIIYKNPEARVRR
jgi:hypothetical protein